MGRYTPQTPCAPRAAKHPLRVCSAPRSLKYPRRKEVPPIDFCHFPVSIIKRSEGRSAVAAAAYRSGTKLTNEWDGLIHDYTRKGGVVHAEIMLPAHAPRSFADRYTLWNSVEQIEKARDSQLAREIEAALPRELSREQQLALVRAYVKDNFVDKGMCADFAIHDKGTGNPHVHIMLTVRPLKENGAWGAKCRKAYDLDENGQRIPDGKGGWKNHREDTTDWNDKGNVEIWRAAWAACTNRALEAAGHPALVDHRSYKRQGIDKIPSVHLGPAASQMEKRGIRTDKGDFNRWVRKTNAMLREVKNKIASLLKWLKAVKEELSKPQSPMLNDLLMTYYNNRNKGAYSTKAKTANLQRYADAFRFLQEKQLFTTDDLDTALHSMQNSISAMKTSAVEKQSRIKELDELLRMAQYYVDGKPVADKLGSIRFEKSRQKYKSEHDDTLRTFYMAERKLKPYFKDGKMPITVWRRERERLEQEYKDIQTELSPLYVDVKKLWAIHYNIYEVQHEQGQQQTQQRSRKNEIEL